jgi:hypothetical protein
MRVIEVLASYTHEYVVDLRIICADPNLPLASAL